MLPVRLAQLTFNATAWKAINNNYSDNHLVSMIIISNEYFLNQACAGLWPAQAWFLKIDPVQIVSMRVCVCVCACVCVCVCVRARGC